MARGFQCRIQEIGSEQTCGQGSWIAISSIIRGYMNDLERFKAIVHFEKPDYVPIFGFPGAPGMAGGAMKKTHQRLVETGMPEYVGGCWEPGKDPNLESWYKYWGTTGPMVVDFFPGEKPEELKVEKRIEGEYEIIEDECGGIVRQVIDNDITYSMPEFVRYPVRDRSSWIVFRDKRTPGQRWPLEKIDEAAKKYDNRDRPLAVYGGSTWGGCLRSLLGTELASTILYDDPDWAREILQWHYWQFRTYLFPLIERLRPEAVVCGEDICYKSGMIISPKHFREFCSPYYQELCSLCRDCGVDMVAIDTDGNAMEFVKLAEECGINAIFPFEVKAGNDLFALRRKHPRFIVMGWLEKEIINEGNGHLIRNEIMSKVPWLLERGGYFPNGDHGIQPDVTFENLCKFMTLLHEVCNNPEGEFPRIHPE